MLAITERLLVEALDWAFCDTGSKTIAKPAHMSRETFMAKAKSIVDWFAPLNPYEVKGPLLKIEDVNYEIGSNELAPLYCLEFRQSATSCLILMSKGSRSFATPPRMDWAI